MPFVYCFHSKQEAESYTTSGTPDTALKVCQVQRNTLHRHSYLQSITVQGKRNGATSMSVLTFRLDKWSTVLLGGTTRIPVSVDDLAPSPSCVVLFASGGGTAEVSSGGNSTGIVGGFGCLASEPGGWMAADKDGSPMTGAGSAPGIILSSSSGTPLLD